MAIDPDKLLNRDFGSVRETYSEKDCILYALGVGMGLDPLDENCLRFVYEDDLKVLPSQSVIMAHPGFWAKEEDTGIDWVRYYTLDRRSSSTIRSLLREQLRQRLGSPK